MRPGCDEVGSRPPTQRSTGESWSRRAQLYGDLEKARLKGLIGEDERLNLTDRLQVIDEELTWQVGRDRSELAAIDEQLKTSKRRRIESFEKELRDHGLADRFPVGYERIRRVLESEDLVTAHEYLAIVERGGELPASSQSAPGFDFFRTSVRGRGTAISSLASSHFFSARTVFLICATLRVVWRTDLRSGRSSSPIF